MKVNVKLFAAMRDATGADRVTVEAGTVGELAEKLGGRWPAAKPLIDRSRFAVNQAFASHETVLREEDEVAVIPPVSGG
ncbi:MAG TPA: MoaD/ThiS family protein [Tepidisphaeraceae bacterium]|nr:MoaD/ThiS family protein [Tepidisphaeraceae bacterium]